MPIIKSTYTKPSFPYFNGHAQTIFPSMFRKIDQPNYERERLELADGDFVDFEEIKEICLKLKKDFKKLLAYIREEYLEVDLELTSEKALKDYQEYNKTP